MGDNKNLVKMFNAPDSVRCPKCKKYVESNFDDYDIECGNPMIGFGRWELDCYCEFCDENFEWKVQVEMTCAIWNSTLPLLCDDNCPSMIDHGLNGFSKRCGEHGEILYHPSDVSGCEQYFIRTKGCIQEHGFTKNWKQD